MVASFFTKYVDVKRKWLLREIYGRTGSTKTSKLCKIRGLCYRSVVRSQVPKIGDVTFQGAVISSSLLH